MADGSLLLQRAQLLSLPLDYDAMTAKQVVALLPTLNHGGRTAVASYERSHRGRATVLTSVERLEASGSAQSRKALDATAPPLRRPHAAVTPIELGHEAADRRRHRRQNVAFALMAGGMLATACVVAAGSVGI